jgi:D-beta-D-heptose 7-phosphate kinase/D-beta-D-heptose 1-phosphate adenosyltransferase
MKKIFTNGCFDILHRGHLELFKYCKSMGHVIVGLNSDASIRRLKGTERPINAEKDRKFILESIKYIDEVLIFDEDTPYELIELVKPDVIVKGGDYTASTVIGADLAEVKIFKYIDGYSTTKIIERSRGGR